MATKNSFRGGKVRGDLRGKIWYLTYQENGRRLRPRVGDNLAAAKQLAAQVNSQLMTGAPSALGFQPIKLSKLQTLWLEQNEHVRRSSLQTIHRYKTATEHLLRFIESERAPQSTSHFRSNHAEQFVRYLRRIEVSPNGHPNSPQRPLLDKGIKHILECCRSLYNIAINHRYVSPYADNPFSLLELDRIPIENAKQIKLFSADQEMAFLKSCDDWQLPIFTTLMMTGLRPGELTHLILPDDLDFESGVLKVRNKPELGWQVKTRNEREIPLMEPLSKLLKRMLAGQKSGLLFQRRPFTASRTPSHQTAIKMRQQIIEMVSRGEEVTGQPISRQRRAQIAAASWRNAGLIKTETIRNEFIELTDSLGYPEFTSPKMLRHLFATAFQEANVDPLIRCQLMGHTTSANGNSPHGLGMTAAYTQTRVETVREQLERAMRMRPLWEFLCLKCRESA